MHTDELIKCLVADLQPVRPLWSPLERALVWLALALPYVAFVVRDKLLMAEPSQVAGDARFLVEQGATLATALAAAIAAFRSIIPGFDPRILLLPLAPLALWIASVGRGCIQDWTRLGADGLTLRPDWDCLAPATIIGIVPALAMVAMLRKGLPPHPRVTLALGALAVAAVANLAMQFAHFHDASIMVLAWHLGAAAVLSALGGWLGTRVLTWRHDPRLG